MPGAPFIVSEPVRIDHLRRRVEQILSDIQAHGRLQVRLYQGHILSYKYPAPRGYGTRGVFVGVYGDGADAQWIMDDLVSLITNQTGDIEPKQE